MKKYILLFSMLMIIAVMTSKGSNGPWHCTVGEMIYHEQGEGRLLLDIYIDGSQCLLGCDSSPVVAMGAVPQHPTLHLAVENENGRQYIGDPWGDGWNYDTGKEHFRFQGSGWDIEFDLELLFVEPSLTLKSGLGKKCSNDRIEFSITHDAAIPNFRFGSSSTYIWQYGVMDAYSISWHNFKKNSGFFVFQEDFDDRIVTNTNIYFRVIAVDDASGRTSSSVVVGPLEFLPPPPTIKQIDILEGSCAGAAGTGKIKLTIDNPISHEKLRYRIGKYCLPINEFKDIENTGEPFTVGANDTASCYWTQLPAILPDNYEINGVPAKKLLLFLTYENSSINNCFTEGINVKTLTVPPIPELSITSSFDSITCHGKNDSKITVDVNSGSGSYIYKLFISDQTDPISVSSTTNSTYTFNQLSKASYTVNVQDQCSSISPSPITIAEPAQVTIKDKTNILKADPTCVNEPNGTIDASTWSIKDEHPVRYEITNQQSTAQLFDNLEWQKKLTPGDNFIKVYDAGRMDCPAGDSITITLGNPVPLAIGHIETVDLRCFGVNTGEIKVAKGSGGSRKLSYTLSSMPSGATSVLEPDSAVLFSLLPADTYHLILSNTGSGCSDFKSQTVIIDAPPKIEVAIDSEDVRCKDEANGKLRITKFVGGTGALLPQWQEWQTSGNYWRNAANLNILAMYPGDYRLITKDSNGCVDTTNVATISEPATILSGTATANDIVCYGELATFSISVAGGNNDQSYIYKYDNGDGLGFRNFVTSDQFDDGVYTIQALDWKGCSAIIGVNLPITKPSEPFDFTYTLSDYNNSNSSCFGNDNGWINIQANGGNGGGYGVTYSGYTYVLDAWTHDNNPLFENLYAGNYTLTVSDRRGCSKITTLTLIQPISELTFNTPVIQNVLCYDYADGSISLSPLGGTAPYTYRIDNNEFNSSGVFGGLGVGEYAFTLRDYNGCTWMERFSVTNTVPKIEFIETIGNVNCFGGNDGFISINTLGGLLPLQYLWKETQSTETDIQNLIIGHYTLLATDAAGCSMTKTFSIGQPEAPLMLSAYTKPVCVGASNGLIRPQATFGTAPYRYAVDQNQNFVFQSEFNALPGIHQIYALDANNCLSQTSVEIEIRNQMPSINFMAATLRYAMDTLVLKEVSVPKPDSVFWSLSPELNITGGNNFEPIITSDYPGQYAVQMTGWFDGCDYTIDKLLQFSEYDPAVVIDNDNQKGIRNIEISPNPNQGDFRVKVDLHIKQQIILKIVDMSAGVHLNKQYASTDALDEYISLPNAPPGVYILMVIAEHDAKAVRIVIN